MGNFAPRSRFRLYTSIPNYFSIFKDGFLGKSHKGDDCEKIETAIQNCSNVAFATCVPQARVGIYLAIKSIINPGQKVILSPYTITDVINMVICAGGVPVAADIDRETCNIDPDQIERLINKDTGVVFITHLHGLACPIDRISEICKRHNVPLIEDSAQAFGAKYEGKMVGSFGDAGIYSFGLYKNLTAFYGGMVVTPHIGVSQKIRAELETYPFKDLGILLSKVGSGLMRDFFTFRPLFQLFTYWMFRFGYLHRIKAINRFVETELDQSQKKQIPDNYLRRMLPLQARIALSNLDRVGRDNATRICFAQIYHEGLNDLQELILPPLRSDGSHIYQYFPIQYKERDVLVRWLMSKKRDIGIQHLKNVGDLPAFKEYNWDCPNARATAGETILLPTYPQYSESQIRRNVQEIRSFFKK
jgi:perosamine synthetase